MEEKVMIQYKRGVGFRTEITANKYPTDKTWHKITTELGIVTGQLFCSDYEWVYGVKHEPVFVKAILKKWLEKMSLESTSHINYDTMVETEIQRLTDNPNA